MREKLIELIENANVQINGNILPYRDYGIETLADHLISNGVFAPPCEIGDTVFALWDVPTEAKYVVYYADVVEIRISKKNGKKTITYLLEPLGFRGRRKEYRIDDFGKTVFLTREEAEKALKGSAKE